MNTWLVLIIIGVISSLFGRSKNQQGKSSKKPFSANGIEDFRELFRELTTDELENEPVDSPPVKMEKKLESPERKSQKLENEYLQVRNESETSRMGQAANRLQKDEIAEQQIHATQEDNESLISTTPDARTLVNGIIWAEILGEPRSKKTYFAKKG